MRMTQFQLGTVRIRTGWSEGQIRQSGYPLADDPHIPSYVLCSWAGFITLSVLEPR